MEAKYEQLVKDLAELHGGDIMEQGTEFKGFNGESIFIPERLYHDLALYWSQSENQDPLYSGKSAEWFKITLNYEGKPPGSVEALESLGVKWLK
jgi:hypothetical protein